MLILTDERGGGDGSVACPREAPVGTVSSMHSPMNAAIYEENMPGIQMARGDIDELITIMTAGEPLRKGINHEGSDGEGI